jgi:SAM-dependent methyltransferase
MNWAWPPARCGAPRAGGRGCWRRSRRGRADHVKAQVHAGGLADGRQDRVVVHVEDTRVHLHFRVAAMLLPRALVGVFAELVRGHAQVVDIGCGPGHMTNLLAGLGLDAFGIDLSPEMVAVARRAHPELRFEMGSMLDLRLANASIGGLFMEHTDHGDVRSRILTIQHADHLLGDGTTGRDVIPQGVIEVVVEPVEGVDVREDALPLRNIRPTVQSHGRNQQLTASRHADTSPTGPPGQFAAAASTREDRAARPPSRKLA